MEKVFRIFLTLRICTVLIVQTWFVPDETWQVTEVAHYWTFGYGYLCWEWKEAIRSILYPGIFSFIYYILAILKIDFVFLLIHIPRLLSSIFFAIGDYYMYKVSVKLFGKASSGWVAVCLSSSWFLAYCSSRTLSSCVEMTLFAIALHNYPWRMERDSLSTTYLVWGGIGCVIRPTMAVFLLPFCFQHLILCQRKMRLLLRYCFTVCSVILLSVGIDSAFYGELTFVPWNFVMFNLVSGLSTHYGSHPWHWYFTHGLPVTCGLHLVPIIFGAMRDTGRYAKILAPALWAILAHSVLGHKEFRFLLPIIPLLLVVAGDSLFMYLKRLRGKDANFEKRNIFFLCVLIIPNVIVFVYMAVIHQRGPPVVMSKLRSLIQYQPEADVLFLTPCHSTPLYSHLHTNIPTRFLTCEPNLLNKRNYKDEADIFFDSPGAWIQNEFGNKRDGTSSLPSHIVMFNVLAARLGNFLRENNYNLCSKVFNAHIFDGQRGKYFHIYCHGQ